MQILGNRSGIENFTAERRSEESRGDLARVLRHGRQLPGECRLAVLRDYQKKSRKAGPVVLRRCRSTTIYLDNNGFYTNSYFFMRYFCYSACFPGARVSPDEERQLLEISALGNVQGLSQWIQKEG